MPTIIAQKETPHKHSVESGAPIFVRIWRLDGHSLSAVFVPGPDEKPRQVVAATDRLERLAVLPTDVHLTLVRELVTAR